MKLGQLALQVNRMADELERMMQAKRDLLLALSHELKSPLARSRVTLELLDESSYRQALLDDQRVMQQLIDEIIEAERSQSDHAVAHREAVAIKIVDQGLDQYLRRYSPNKIQSSRG